MNQCYMFNKLAFLFFAVAISLAGCGGNGGDSALVGTWTLKMGDVKFLAPVPMPGRQLTFQVHDHKLMNAFNSNGKIDPKVPISVEGREDVIIFKPSGEYILYTSGIALDMEQIFEGLPIYETGKYETSKGFIKLIPTSLNGTTANGPGRSIYKMEYKVDNDGLTIIWEHNYYTVDPANNNPALIILNGKLSFVKISNDVLLPKSIKESIETPDQTESPGGTFYGLTTPDTNDNPNFIPTDTNIETSQDIIAQHAVLGLKLVSKQKPFAISGLSTPESFYKANLTLHLLSRLSSEKYLAYRNAELARLGFSQTEFEGDNTASKWIPRAYSKTLPNQVSYLFEAVRERNISNTNPIPRLYVVRAKLEFDLVDADGKEKPMESIRDWNRTVQFLFLHYLSEEARFRADGE